MTTLISAGTTALEQNTIYALPARPGIIHSSAAVEISADGVSFNALTNAETVGANVGSAFLRCTTSTTCVVVYRPY